MDEIVLRAMAKWPNVPDVFGWLALDRRGRWLLRGEPIGNSAANQFISRNYASDEQGRWFFQNGPQRVFVHLHYAPWVISLDGNGTALTHTGLPVDHVESAWVDDDMNLLLLTELGLALVHDQDLASMTEAFCNALGNPLSDEAIEHALSELAEGQDPGACLKWGQWGETPIPISFVPAATVASRFRFDRLTDHATPSEAS